MPATSPPPLHPHLDAPVSALDSTKQFIVRAAIFKPSTGEHKHKHEHELLIIKRAEDESHANHWEMPGGGVERAADATVRCALAREVREETGLEAVSVLGELEERNFRTRSGRENVEFNYAVAVKQKKKQKETGDEVEVKLCDEEHSAWCWVKEADIDGFLMMEGMRNAVRNAFEFARRDIE